MLNLASCIVYQGNTLYQLFGHSIDVLIYIPHMWVYQSTYTKWCTLQPLHLGVPYTITKCTLAPLYVSILKQSIGTYFAAFAGKCTKVYSIGDVIAHGAHMLTFMKLYMHWPHWTPTHTLYSRQDQQPMTTKYSRLKCSNSMVQGTSMLTVVTDAHPPPPTPPMTVDPWGHLLHVGLLALR